MSFIVCASRKSNPRISIEMCLKCRKAAFCESYRIYKEPFLFREMNRPGIQNKKKRPHARVEGKKAPKEQVQEQSSFIPVHQDIK